MKAWTHPSLGSIELIPRRLRPKKVWQHFYDAGEHWERVCNADVVALRGQAEAAVGVVRARKSDLPQLSAERWRRARDLLTSHHDANYAPAYREEMSSPDTIWTPSADAINRHKALTPRSVFIVVQMEPLYSWVVTAFRPHPPVQDVELDEADLRRHGAWYFRKETGVNIDEFALAVVDNLRRSSQPPTSARSLWWLASAVGYGRLLGHIPDVHDALLLAEKTLSETPVAVLQQLRQLLGWEPLAGQLAQTIKETRPEGLEAVLAEAEELLAVAAALGVTSEAEAFCEEAEMLISWLPSEWAHLADHARHRVQGFTAQPSLVSRPVDRCGGCCCLGTCSGN